MKYSEALVAWNPNYDWITTYGRKKDEIKVVPWPDKQRLSRSLLNTCGACYCENRELEEGQRIAQTFIDFHTIVVRDGVNPQDAHQEFLKIDEYRKHVAPDIKGA